MRLVAMAAGLVLGCGVAGAQVADVGVCELVNHPAKYDGQMVRVKGTVQSGFDSFLMLGDTCSSMLWLSYPAGTNAKSGPATVVELQLAANATAAPGKVRPAVALTKDKEFAAFDALLTQKVKTQGMCLGCVKNDVVATLTGRFDGTLTPGLQRDAAGKVTGLDGFGNLNEYGARLVITSVTGATAKEVDYSAAAKVSGDANSGGDKDFMGSAKKSAEAYPKGSDSANKVQAAVAAFGGPGEQNGVVIDFSGLADVPAGEGAKAAVAYPGELLISVKFDMDKLKGDALSRALAHDGGEIVDLRKGNVPGLGQMEQDGFQVALLETIGSHGKSLTLPGGFVIWDSTWTAAENAGKASAGLQRYLGVHEGIQ